jgi:hypothetical protein
MGMSSQPITEEATMHSLEGIIIRNAQAAGRELGEEPHITTERATRIIRAHEEAYSEIQARDAKLAVAVDTSFINALVAERGSI